MDSLDGLVLRGKRRPILQSGRGYDTGRAYQEGGVYTTGNNYQEGGRRKRKGKRNNTKSKRRRTTQRGGIGPAAGMMIASVLPQLLAPILGGR